MGFTVGSEYDLSMALTSPSYIDPLLVRLDLRDPDGIITTHQTPDPAIVRDDRAAITTSLLRPSRGDGSTDGQRKGAHEGAHPRGCTSRTCS